VAVSIQQEVKKNTIELAPGLFVSTRQTQEIFPLSHFKFCRFRWYNLQETGAALKSNKYVGIRLGPLQHRCMRTPAAKRLGLNCHSQMQAFDGRPTSTSKGKLQGISITRWARDNMPLYCIVSITVRNIVNGLTGSNSRDTAQHWPQCLLDLWW
jgi:hypothetical protein